jgi:hypothetical protein
MLYSGYHFSQWPDGSIQLDEELTATKLGLQENDKFILQIVNGKVVFRKVVLVPQQKVE